MTASVAAHGPRPRMLFIIGSLQAGGAERQLSALANFWAACGAHVTLSTWNGPEVADFYTLDPQVNRVHLGVNGSGSRFVSLLGIVAGVLRLRRLIKASRPDVLLSFIDVSNVCSIAAAGGLNARVVVAERTHPAFRRSMGRPWRLLRRLTYPHADLVVAQTYDASEWLERKCRARVAVIPNALRELPGVSSGPREPLIVGVGRLTAEKGFDLLLRAFSSLQRDFPTWRVCLIGDGPERSALVRLCSELKLEQQVEFVGEVREVDGWLASASLLVHPSRREGFPNAVLEAMGMGLPVICADCRAGPSELIQDRVNGRLVPVDDIAELTAAMAELMASSDSRERLGREALRVRQRYSQARIMEEWRACLLPQATDARALSVPR
jgi:GalNAc-alpha-(1->4)-GalNAc-alpha-(1->3)-diNAcBac-PP-undecaprenol alpha-1,4-N-acetyl-D-galactosaminyltransferase